MHVRIEYVPGHPVSLVTLLSLPDVVERLSNSLAASPVSEAPKPSIICAVLSGCTVMTGFDAVPVGGVAMDWRESVVCEFRLVQLFGLMIVAVTVPEECAEKIAWQCDCGSDL